MADFDDASWSTSAELSRHSPARPETCSAFISTEGFDYPAIVERPEIGIDDVEHHVAQAIVLMPSPVCAERIASLEGDGRRWAVFPAQSPA